VNEGGSNRLPQNQYRTCQGFPRSTQLASWASKTVITCQNEPRPGYQTHPLKVQSNLRMTDIYHIQSCQEILDSEDSVNFVTGKKNAKKTKTKTKN
jgi:hypothetical protein